MIRRHLSRVKQYIRKEILHIPVKIYPIKKTTIGIFDQGSCDIPVGLLNENSICYSFGAGEMISFDIALVDAFKCNLYLFDPTPRAMIYYNLLVKKTLGQEYVVPPHSIEPWENMKKEHIPKFHYSDIGIWKEKTTLKFYEPENPKDVSFSLVNLQKTEKFIEVKVDRLSNIMKELGHKTVDFLKVDAEGAEYEVIKSIIEDRPDVKAMDIEFDELNYPMDSDFRKRIVNAVKSLEKIGYVTYYTNPAEYNFELIRRDVYEDLRKRQ